jgi:hypothetical protein
MAFAIPVRTALLPTNFVAPPHILAELRPIPSHPIIEYSGEEQVRFRNIPCIPIDGSAVAPWTWTLANPMTNWTITFQSNETIYGTKYWIDYEPDGLLEYLRNHSNNYDLIYRRDGINIFTLQVTQFSEAGQWKVRINTVWHTTPALFAVRQATIELDLVLLDMQSIFNNHNQCTVCLDDAFLVRWPACNHSFCTDCISIWRRHTNTCPLCRAHVS